MAERPHVSGTAAESTALAVPTLMPQLKSDLAQLMAIPSISGPEFVRQLVAEAYEGYTE